MNAGRAKEAAPKPSDMAIMDMYPWFWSRQPNAAGRFEVYALIRPAGPADDGSRLLICECPTAEIARTLCAERQIAEAATNLLGKIFSAMKGIATCPEMDAYNGAWRRSTLRQAMLKDVARSLNKVLDGLTEDIDAAARPGSDFSIELKD